MRLVVGSKPIQDWERRKSNIAAAGSYPLFKPLEGTSGPVVLCAAGPSLLKNIELVRAFYEAGVPICAIKGVGSMLIERGIIPKYCVFLDSRPDQLRLVGTTHKDTIYCLASQVDPEIYRRLAGHQIRVFHASNLKLHQPGDDYITGGSTTSMRAINLMQWAGYTMFHVIGLDCCEDGGVSHVYDKTTVNKTIKVFIAGREFLTRADLAAQHQEFLEEYILGKPPLNVTVYGGAIAASLEALGNKQSPWMEIAALDEEMVLLEESQVKEFRNGDDIVVDAPLSDEEKKLLDLTDTVAQFYNGKRGVAIPDEQLRAHTLHALSRKWPEHRWVPPHNGEAIICGGGPSIKDPEVIREIRSFSKRAFICTVNMTHDHFLGLYEKGLGQKIVPHANVLIDPKERTKDYVHPIPGPLYFVASQCNPHTLDVFEQPGVKKFLFHHEDKHVTALITKQHHATPPMFSTVGLESILINYRLGFRKFRLFAMESSYQTEMRDGKLTPVYLHGYAKEKEYLDVIPIEARDPKSGSSEVFLTNAHMACQAEDFKGFVPYWDHHVRLGHYEPIRIIIHGEGLLPTSAKYLNRQYPWVQNARSLRSRLRRGNRRQGPGQEPRGEMPGQVREAQAA